MYIQIYLFQNLASSPKCSGCHPGPKSRPQGEREREQPVINGAGSGHVSNGNSPARRPRAQPATDKFYGKGKTGTVEPGSGIYSSVSEYFLLTLAWSSITTLVYREPVLVSGERDDSFYEKNVNNS